MMHQYVTLTLFFMWPQHTLQMLADHCGKVPYQLKQQLPQTTKILYMHALP